MVLPIITAEPMTRFKTIFDKTKCKDLNSFLSNIEGYMGSVKTLSITGDNDQEIHPTEYYRHYMYCDKCGSFDIKNWKEPDNHEQLAKKVERFEKIAYGFFTSAVLAAVIILLWFIIELIFADKIDISKSLFVILGVTVVMVLLSMFLSGVLSSKIKHLGVFCDQCSETYENGSVFFNELDSNPRNYTMDHVPRPVNTNYWVRSEKK
ncbi:MAG: hypothetical protein ACI9FN_001006 [Saprospiraceae bacterium]